MKQAKPSSNSSEPPLLSELLVLPDGRILAHNVTASLAALLRALVPDDGELALRVESKTSATSQREQDVENSSMKISKK